MLKGFWNWRRAVKQVTDRIPENAIFDPGLFPSDEKVLVKWTDDTCTLLVNCAADVYDARLRVLHVATRPYAHVAEDQKGRWLYRGDN